MTELEISLDAQADAMYVWIKPKGTKVKSSDCDIAANIIVDLDSKGDVVGIEFLAVNGRDLDDNVTQVLNKYSIDHNDRRLNVVKSLLLRKIALVKWELK